MNARILIAGIGNIFLGDDAFGCEAAQALTKHALPAEVAVRDFGIRCLELAYLLDADWTAVIVLDAVSRGQPPGTLYRIALDDEPEPVAAAWRSPERQRADPAGNRSPHSQRPTGATRANSGEPPASLNPHSVGIEHLRSLARQTMVALPSMFLIGCEPLSLEPVFDNRSPLSPPVAAALPRACAMTEAMIQELLASHLQEVTTP